MFCPFCGGGFGFDGGFGALNLISMILFWLIIIFAVIWFIRYFQKENNRGYKEKTSEDILKERYAKGEIEKKEFEEKMKDLKK